ncbi:MAG: type IV pilus secretin PilQ [Gammaproteobacteria bacterium]|nr:type IV pilus secretin PilQ [Gammaproteobacteria bacterium]
MKIIKQAKIARTMGRNLKRFITMLVPITTLLFAGGVMAADRVLEDISFSSLSGDRVQIKLTTDSAMPQPLSFTIDNPARIAIDLVDTSSNLKSKSLPINVGVAKSATTIEAGGRTRVVLNLAEMVVYDLDVQGSDVIITLGGIGDSNALIATSSARFNSVAAEVTNVDFRRGAAGEGIVVVEVSDPAVTFDVREEGGKIIVDFIDVSLPQSLAQRFDVIDFATPVQTIDTTSAGSNVRMVISAKGFYEHLAYQSDKVFSVQVTEVSSQAKKEELQKERFGYTGKRLSLNFQDVPVRAVLQLIADFTDLNMVASDTVDGSITLRLRNVPWDQALDIILKTKGLAKRQSGNVILVGPADEILAREQQELESKQQIAELAPIRSELIQINYAKANDIAALLQGDSSSLLSERGAVSVDERTNTLLVNDTADKLEDIRKLLLSLDIPIRQVLIESRIVVANDDFSKELGARFGFTQDVSDFFSNGSGGLLSGGGLNSFTTATDDDLEPGERFIGDGLNSDLGISGPQFGSFGISFARLPTGTLIDLELTAMQAESRGEVVSSPKVVTANQQEALIEQGTEIPFQEATSSGATAISFKSAVLSLRVTPQITPDDRIIMDLNVKNDSVGQIFFGVPSIDTNEVQTQVLVDNGETIVLGGIFQEETNVGRDKVPFFGDLPVVGRLFRRDLNQHDKEELLIFITPKILKDGLSTL